MNGLLRKHPGNHVGYVLQAIAELSGAPLGWDGMSAFKKIPGKLTAYLVREKIAEVRRYAIKSERHQYFIKTVDGRYFEANY